MPSIKRWARRTRRRIEIVAAILRHPQTPWYARMVGVLVIAYAASPIDLIPDFIPVFGYLDDLLLIPLGIVLVVHLTPKTVREQAMRSVVRGERQGQTRWRHLGTMLIVIAWIAAAYGVMRLLFNISHR
jgi:uncharacterized membrane protein YkvA (DUF1232 family)